MRKSDLLAELTDVLSDGVSQDLWLLSVGIDNNLSGQYQLLIPNTHHKYKNLTNATSYICTEPDGLCGNQLYCRELLMMDMMVPETC